ncbi:hypothetical protein ACEUBF_06870 [Aeromonas caviae]|uniref:hypothetical protein n=1 Tax=Aeromonas caviae TaxID=648 RepID=UPI0038CF485C
MKSNLEGLGWDKEEFVMWLELQGLSRRVARDYMSRCLRVESFTNESLCIMTSSSNDFLQLMELIHDYAVTQSDNYKSIKSLKGSLRLAVRKFSIFKYGEVALKYPNGYSLVRR